MNDNANPFDLTVTHRDPKTGLVIKQDPYILRIVAAADGGKTRVFERPKGSGNLWDKKGQPAGRWVKGKWDKEAAHVAFVMPETADQKLVREKLAAELQASELAAELAAVKAELEAAKKTKAAPPVQSNKKDQGA